MTRPAIQLYTLRDIDESLPEIIRRVSDAGFEGVEFAYRFENAKTDEVAAALDETGIEPIGAHIGLQDLERDPDMYMDRYEPLGCRAFAIPHLPITHFRTERRITELADRLNAIGEVLDDRGFQLLYHNQDHDFLPLTGRTPLSQFLVYDVSDRPISPFKIEQRLRKAADRVTRLGGLLDDQISPILDQYIDRDPAPIIGGTAFGRLVQTTDPKYVSFEVDTGGVFSAGYDPSEVLQRLDGRVPYVHLNDVTVDQTMPGTGEISVEPGTGNVDFKKAATTAQEVGAEWLVYEHDAPKDPLRTLENGAQSVIPLTSNEEQKTSNLN